jgi:hypothetical protein
MKSISEMTEKEKAEILSLAEQIKSEQYRESMFQSLSEAKNIMIRWDTPYGKYKQSYFSVNVSADEIEYLVKSKILGEPK